MIYKKEILFVKIHFLRVIGMPYYITDYKVFDIPLTYFLRLNAFR